MRMDAKIVANPPNDLIYDFKGQFIMNNSLGENNYVEPLSLENTLWSNTVLASNGFILGMVVYTGKETRSQMNTRGANTKIGKLDLELNKLSKYLFVFMLVTSAAFIAMD